MRYDEAFTVWRYAARSLRTVVGSYSLPNNHVFHTLLVDLAIRIGGLGPWVVRMPALIAGVALVPVSFVVFARLRGHLAGLLTASLVTGSSVLIDYSVNARGYTVAALLALVAVGVAAEIPLDGTWAWRALPLGLIGAFGLWTLPVFVYPWAGTLLWLLLRNQGNLRERMAPALTAGLSSVVGAGVLYMPILLNDGVSALVGNKFVTPDPFGIFVVGAPRFLAAVGAMWSHNVPTVVVVMLSAGLIYGLSAEAMGETRTLAWSLVLAVSGLFLAQHVIPYARNWLVLLPLVMGLAASGVASITEHVVGASTRRWMLVGPLIVAAWLMVSVLGSSTTLSGESDGLVDAEAITLELAPRLSRMDYIAAAIPSTAPLRYYFELYGMPIDPLLPPAVIPEEIFVVTALDQTAPEVLTAVGAPGVYDVSLISDYPSGSLWTATRNSRGEPEATGSACYSPSIAALSI